MSKNDNIERAFQDKFDSDSIENQGWNEPRDIIWDKIDNDLSRKSNRRFGIPFFMLLTGLLISLGGIGYVLKQNNDLTAKVNEIRIELDQCGKQTEVNQSDISKSTNASNVFSQNSQRPNLANKKMKVPNENEINEELENSINQKNTPLNRQQKSISESSSYKIASLDDSSLLPEIYKVKKNIHSSVIKVNKTEFEEKGGAFKKSKGAIVLTKRQNQILTSLPQKSINPVLDTESILYPSKIQTIPLAINNDLHSFLSLSGGIMGNKLIKNGRQSSVLTEAIDREYAKLGSIIEVKYTSKISNRWSASIGLGIVSQEFVTEYDLTLPYTVGEEVIENGIGYIDFEHSLPTSFGNTDTELRLRRQDADQVLEEENVKIDFNTKHNFLSLTAPLSIDYFGSSIHSGFFVGVDAVPAYIISTKSGISSVVSQHSKIESVNNESTSDYVDLEKVNLALGAHIGYRYSITQKSGLEFNAKYLQNLSSYFSSASFTSRSHGVQLSAGYFFKF